MTVLIQRDTMTHQRPSRSLDAHGWAEDDALTDLGTVEGTLQEATPLDDPRATGSGHGPALPAHTRKATAYIASEAQPGDVLGHRGVNWRVQTARFIEDPRKTGELDCWVLEVSEVPNVD
jgi:hypothetical protein